MQWLPTAEPGDVIACAQCGAHLRRLTRYGTSRVLPLTLAAAVTFMVMITAPICVGQDNQFHLIRHTDRTLLWINTSS